MTDAEIIKANDILDKFDFFNQRVGRELWSDKPKDIQDKDIENFLNDVKFLKDLINRLQADKEALIAGQETLQKALAEKNEEFENQSQNFKVLVSDHRTLQQSFDNLKGLYEAEKAKVEKAKEKCIGFAKELQTAKAELKETTEKFNCQQYVYTDLSDIIKEKNAEIEKLQADNSSMQSTLAKMSMGVEQAKAEAIKEFAERLKTQKTTAISCDLFEEGVRKSDIDNLILDFTKMVGGD